MTRPSDISPAIWQRADILCDQFRHVSDDTEFVARILIVVAPDPVAAGLTERQAGALVFITSFIAANGFSPTYREIAEGLGLKSSYAAHLMVHHLVERGAITIVPRRSRSIAVVEASA